MAEKTVSVKLTARIDAYKRAMSDAKRYTTDFSNSGKNFKKIGTSMTALGTSMTRNVSLPLAALAVGATAAAVSWESAWTGVTKTVDGTASQLERLEGDLRAMAMELPATHAEIAGVAEAAGQLGVGVDDIAEFTEVMIGLGETTNLTADEAATALARISNIMGTSVGDVDRMASVIVELGNNSETTEAEIVELGTRIAAAGKIAGLSEADVFAFASTLTSVGVNAEAGGTALSKTFHAINDAVIDGGESLETFARVAGMTTDQFAASFQEDAAGAIASFIEGLGRMTSAGQSTTGVLDDVGLSNERTRQALLSTGEAGEVLSEQLAMGRSAWEENTAAAEEAEKRYATTQAQLEILRNKLVDLGIDIGQMLIPALMSIVDVAQEVIDIFQGMPEPVQKAILILGGIAAVLGPMLIVVGSLITAYGKLKLAMLGMSAASMTNPIFLATAAVGALAAAWIFLGDTADDEVSRVSQRAEDMAARVDDLARAMDAASSPAAGFADHLKGLLTENDILRESLAASGVTLDEFAEALMVDVNSFGWGAQFRDITAAARDLGYTTDEVHGLSMQFRFLARDGAAAKDVADDLAAIEGELGDASVDAAGGAAELASATDDATDAAWDREAAVQALLAAEQEMIDLHLSAISTMFDYEKSTTALDNSYADLTDAMFENMATQGDSEKTTKEKETAVRDLRLQELALADDLYASSEAFATEEGAVLGSREAIRLQIGELKRQRDQYPELREEIDAMIGKLEAVPGVVKTTMSVEMAAAHAQIDSLIYRIGQVPRNININATVVGGSGLGRLTQYDTGGYIANDQIAQLHKSEVVLPLTNTSRMADLMSDTRVWGPMSDAISRMASPSKAPTPQVASTIGGSSAGGDNFQIEINNNGRDFTERDMGRTLEKVRLSR